MFALTRGAVCVVVCELCGYVQCVGVWYVSLFVVVCVCVVVLLCVFCVCVAHTLKITVFIYK